MNFSKLFVYFSIILIFIYNINAEEVEINILHINDTHSNLQPGKGRDTELKGKEGGIARAVSVIGQAKANDSETLLLHGGDFFMCDLTWYFSYGIPELSVLNSLGWDAVTIGNHEFDGTSPALLNVIKDFNGINFLSANLKYCDEEVSQLLKSIIKGYFIKNVKGIKVGIFGMTQPIANEISMPQPEIEIQTNLLETAISTVTLMKTEGCQVIIFLSHLGFLIDSQIAENVEGIDLIISAHDHIEKSTEVGNTLIVQAGSFYQHVGSVKLIVEDGKVKSSQHSLIKLDASIPEEPNTVAMINGLLAEQPDAVQELFDTQIANCTDDMSEWIPVPTEAGNRSTDVGCLIADAFKEYGHTDIGFTTSGLSAQQLFKGPLVANDVFRMIGYGVNTFDGIGYEMCKFRIKGSDLRTGIVYCLNQVYSDLADEFLPQVSGMKIEYHHQRFNECSITIAGDEIDPDTYYSITTSVFVKQLLVTLFQLELTDVTDMAVSDYSVVLNYVIEQGSVGPYPGTNCERVISPVETINFNPTFSGLKISPNPAENIVNITVNNDVIGNYTLEFYDYKGMKSFQGGSYYLDGAGNTFSVNTGFLKSGAYLMKLSDGKNSYFGKIIISK